MGPLAALFGCVPAPTDASTAGAAPSAALEAVAAAAALRKPGLVWRVDRRPGDVVGDDDLGLLTVPDFVPDVLLDPALAVGTTVREPVFAGEPVRLERLVSPAGRTGIDALADAGEEVVRLRVGSAAFAGADPGCAVEVLAPKAGRPRPLGDGRIVATFPAEGGEGALAVALAPEIHTDDAAVHPVVLLPTGLGADVPNDGPITFEPPARPGSPVAVARRTLAAGRMIRSDDLGEVGGAGLDAMRVPDAWARVPFAPIYPGELVDILRLTDGGRGACTEIPEGLAGVGIRSAEMPSQDLVGTEIAIRVDRASLDDLYVAAVFPVAQVVLLFARPERARAIAVAAAEDVAFQVRPSAPGTAP